MSTKCQDKVDALLEACKKGEVDVVKRLIDENFDISINYDKIINKFNTRTTPLYFATINNHLEVVKLLLNKSDNSQIEYDRGYKIAHIASEKGYTKIVEFLLETNPDYFKEKNKSNDTVLFLAVQNNHLDTVEAILKHKPEIDAKFDGMTALHIACEKGYVKIAKVLLENNAAIECKDQWEQTALHLAIQNQRLGVIKCLIKYGADLNADGYYGRKPLHYCIEKGYKDIVKLLVENKADLNSVDRWKRTPLHVAARHSDLEIVKLLVDRGVEINVNVNARGTPLREAASRGCLDIARFLISRGADIEATDSARETSLFLAIRNNNIEMVKMLISCGANLNIGANGNTPLHVASECGCTEIVRILIENKANPNCKNYKADTPFEISKNQDIGKILLLHTKIPRFPKAFSQFKDEITSMKETKITNNCTLFDIFTVNVNVLARLVQNQVLKELYANGFKKNFKHYKEILKEQYNRGIQRRKVFCSSVGALGLLIGTRIPDICREKICTYLSDYDLKSLLDSTSIFKHNRKRRAISPDEIPLKFRLKSK